MAQRYFLPFGSFAPDNQEFDSPHLNVADNAIPVFGGLRPVRQKSVIATKATTGAVTGAHAHLLLATEQIQIGRPISDISLGVWRGMPGATSSSLYANIDEVTASDADFVVNGGGPAGASSAEFRLTSLGTPGSNAHTMRWRYKVSSYSATPASVTSITRAGAVATITTAAAHGLSTGDTLVVAGADQAEYNGSHAFTSTGANTGTFAVSGAPATPATGTITWKKGWYIKADLVETATVRATSTVRGSADVDWTAASYTLSAGEYAAITGYTDLRVRFTASVPGVAQELRPTSDVDNTGAWKTGADASTNLYAELDETSADDATSYIKTPSLVLGAATRDYTAAFASGSDPLLTTSNVFAYRYKATNAGVTLKASLMQGSTEIASNTHTNAATSYSDGSITLSSGQYASITDWTALRVRLQGSYPTSTSSTATQSSRPSSDNGNFGWLNSTGGLTNLYADLDESVASDVDAIAASSGIANACDLDLATVSDPLVSNDHVLKIRAKSTSASDSLIATLKSAGSTIKSVDFGGGVGIGPLTSSYQTFSITLSAAEADSISSYSQLTIELTAYGASSGVGVAVSWLALEVPEPRAAHVSWAEMQTASLASGQASWFELQIPDPNNTYNADTQEIYAGTQSAIYEVDASAFTDVSIAGGYATSGDTPHSWSFASWGGDVLATNYIDEVQSRAAGASLFANLMTSTERPNARFVTVIGPHVVLGDIINSGGTITGHADMVWWSAIDDAADFDPDVATQCDYQRLRGTPGQIMGLVGGIDYGLVFKRNSIYRMTYQGAPLIFSFESISTQVGTPSPRSIVQVDDDVYFWTGNSFAVLRNGRELDTSIGDGAVLKMLRDYPFETHAIESVQASDQRVMDAIIYGAYCKHSGLILWAYRDKNETAGLNDEILVLNPRTNEWGYITDNSLNIAALLSLNNVMTDDTHLLKGVAGFSYDGSANSDWWKFSSTSTYAMTLTSKIVSAQAITSSERRGGDLKVQIVGVRPIFAGQPAASTDPAVVVTVTPSIHPLMQDSMTAATATAATSNIHGVYPVSPPIVGEYFRFSTAIPSLSSQTIKSMPGIEVFFEDNR